MAHKGYGCSPEKLDDVQLAMVLGQEETKMPRLLDYLCNTALLLQEVGLVGQNRLCNPEKGQFRKTVHTTVRDAGKRNPNVRAQQSPASLQAGPRTPFAFVHTPFKPARQSPRARRVLFIPVQWRFKSDPMLMKADAPRGTPSSTIGNESFSNSPSRPPIIGIFRPAASRRYTHPSRMNGVFFPPT
jgi:hypothetical protein